MPNIIIKRHTNPPNRLIIAKKNKQKLNNKWIIINHQTETSRRKQFDLTIESMQQSIETHVIWLLNLIVGNAEYYFCFNLQIKFLNICDCQVLFYLQTTWIKLYLAYKCSRSWITDISPPRVSLPRCFATENGNLLLILHAFRTRSSTLIFINFT